MAKKLIFSLLAPAFVLVAIAAVMPVSASAQTSSPFPPGCSSGLGYSVTTAAPCNGTGVATPKPMPGCATALGYSITTGRACSGTNVVLNNYLAGCTSVLGYSTFDGAPCNGTNVVTHYAPNTPGFPVTGSGENAPIYAALAALTGLIAFFGVRRLIKRA